MADAVAGPVADPTSIACLEVWGGNEPIDTAVRVPGLDVFIYAVPFANASAGGDVHFVSSCSSGRVARLMVADVSGHGEAVADIARKLRSLIKRYMNHIDQRKLLMSMNERFRAMAEAGRFATAVVMTYFAPTATLSLCNAGHPPPLFYRRATGAWRYLDDDTGPMEGVTNIPLGILADVGYEQFEVDLERGDLVLIYTDSLIEAICRDGEQLGPQRLLEIVTSVDVGEPGHASHVVHHLVARLSVCGATLADDVTIVLGSSLGRSNGANFFGRLWGELKAAGQMVTFRPNAPWPELSWRNLIGVPRTKRSRTPVPARGTQGGG